MPHRWYSFGEWIYIGEDVIEEGEPLETSIVNAFARAIAESE